MKSKKEYYHICPRCKVRLGYTNPQQCICHLTWVKKDDEWETITISNSTAEPFEYFLDKNP